MEHLNKQTEPDEIFIVWTWSHYVAACRDICVLTVFAGIDSSTNLIFLCLIPLPY